MDTTTVDDKFQLWISQYPESLHPLDMQRFYRFVKAVCESGSFHDGSWLEAKISGSKHSLSEELVRRYCSLFIDLQDFYRA